MSAFRIGVVVPYFGKWPPWINFFIESCRANGDIDWIMFSDAEPPENRASNVRHVSISFAEYKAIISDRLDIRFDPTLPYKLCDVRPALPFIHRDLLSKYDFVGFGDIDVIYGRIRSFYDDETLSVYDALSSHPERVSGHFFLMRNNEGIRTAFMRVPGWRKAMAAPDYVGFDESGFYRAFRGRAGLLRAAQRVKGRFLFRETYSTPSPTDEMRWIWEEGRLTNEFYPHREFMYLHFMSWHSSRWYGHMAHVVPGTPAPWARLQQVVDLDWRTARRSGFMISPRGIGPIERPRYH